MTTIHKAELLRGIPVSKVMGGFCRLFREGGDAETHMAMARQVPALQDFISHNWVVSRYTKWSTLSLHYSVRPAWAAAMATGVCTSLLVIFGFLTPLDMGPQARALGPLSTGEGERARGLWAYFLGQLVFLVTPLFWQDAKQLLPLQERMAFVDRACIHQTDRAKMLEGIQNLAGFLRHTDHMVLCCGPTYFRKLWTVYEIASFLSIHRDPSRMQLYPTTWAQQVVRLTLCSFLLILSTLLLVLLGLVENSFYVGIGLGLLPQLLLLSHCLRQTVRVLQRIKEDLSRFDIRDAQCAVESDRPLVHANVSTFMRELGRVPEDAEEWECLDAFNYMVQTEFLYSISNSRTVLSVQVLIQLCWSVPMVLLILDDCAVLFLRGQRLSGLAWFVNHLEYFHVSVLSGNVVLVPLLSRRLELCGWREGLYLLLVSLLVALLYVLLATLLLLASFPALDVAGRPWERWLSVALTLLLQALLLAATLRTSQRPCGASEPPPEMELQPSDTFTI